MKEHDIYDKYGLKTNDNGDTFITHEDGISEDVGCLHCFIHGKAQETLEPIQVNKGKIKPLCPKCGKVLTLYTRYGYDHITVSEQNSYVPEGNIGLYEAYHCDDCEQNYAMMPIPISWNANHDTHYTGGRRFAEDADVKAIVKDLWDNIAPYIQNYAERKADPKDWIDKGLKPWNVLSWTEGEVEAVVCNWLYEHGFKR